MATSLLAGYNWADLSAEEMTSAVQALAKATQERCNIGFCSMSGTYSTSGSPSFPSEDTLSKIFPWGGNTSLKWELNIGDPLTDLSQDVQDMLYKCAQNYADIEKWNDADTNKTVSSTLWNLLGVADAPLTYDNRLFEITGYTSWPDLSVYDKREVKKWYDMLTEMKYAFRDIGNTNDDYLIFEGEFDQDAEPFYNADDDLGRGAEWFAPSDPTDSAYVDPATTTPYSDFKTANSGLFGTFSTTYNEDTGTAGTYPPYNNARIYSAVFKRDTSGDYACYIRAYKMTHVGDYTDFKATTGTSNKPISYKYQTQIEISENFPTGEDTNMTYPQGTTADNQRYYCDLTVTENGDNNEIEVDFDVTTATFPTNLTDIASDESVTGIFELGGASTYRYRFLEFWDGDGGFEYYTPP